MKQILFASAICLALGAQAQKLEIGGNFGLAHTFDKNVGGGQLYYSGKVAYNLCRLQVGISSNITHLPYEAVMSSELYSSTHPPITPVFDIYSPATQAVHNLKLFANAKRNIGLGAMTVYSGVSAGIMNAIQPGPKSKKAAMNTLTTGYSAGVQAGATYNVTKRFGVNAEVGADYINMKANGMDFGREAGRNNLSTINMPITVGFRYKLSCPCPKSCPMSNKDKAPVDAAK